MVQQALNRHSQITIPPETKFFFSFLNHSRRNQLRHLDRLNRDLRISLVPPAAAIRGDQEGRAFFDEMAQQYVAGLRPTKAVTSFGEKTPEHTGHIPRIRQLFPDAKILVLYRDGRDVALSLSKAPWMPADLYVCFLVWLYYQRLVMHLQQSAMPNVYFARYENIVVNPEKEFAGILHFLDLPYESAVPHEYGNSEGIPEREYPWKANALRKITEERVGVFRRELGRGQIEILERLGKDTLASFGYPLLSGGEAPLSLSFLLKLSRDTASFVYQMPLYSLLHELADRALSHCVRRFKGSLQLFQLLRKQLPIAVR